MTISALRTKLAFYKSKVGQHCVTNWREVASASHYWSKSPVRAGRDCGGAWNGSMRWIENVDAIGLRFVGFADKIVSINHEGWFTDHFQDGLMRGAVWQLPARNGASLYVYGYCDENNEGAAFIDFEHTGDKEKAARWADQLAESCAEKERDYQAKDQAERDIEDARSSIHENNIEALALIREIKNSGSFSPAICSALKAQLQKMLNYRANQFDLINTRTSDYWSAVEV